MQRPVMSKHQLAHISMHTITHAFPKPCYLYEPLHSASFYASRENCKRERVQMEHSHELEQHKTPKNMQPLVSWQAPKHYLISAIHRWPLSMLRRSTFSFYHSSKMLQGCCFTPGIMALEEAARKAGQSCSFCRATTTLLSFSVYVYHGSISAFP